MDYKEEHNHKWYIFTCKDATLLMTKEEYSKLKFSEKFLLKFHLLICLHCNRFLKQTRNIRKYFKASADNSTLTLSAQKKQSLSQLITENTKK